MRARIVIPLLFVGLVMLLLPFVVRPGHAAAGPGTKPAGQRHPGRSPAPTVETPPNPAITFDTANAGSATANYEDYVNQRTAELEDLGMSGDPNALTVIESELDDRDPQIQSAAISAAIQFGSRDAIPALEDASTHTDDPAQKLSFHRAIAFLQLPTQAEALRGNPSDSDQ